FRSVYGDGPKGERSESSCTTRQCKKSALKALFCYLRYEDSNLPQVWVLPDALRLSGLQTAPLT
ncbi:hypothetical protein, partial [Salmonella enterica]|uniref:hypothetical protein n=1 Tax=Salmonella enterica TaxID=28901 RepID=UPI001C38B56F